MYSLVKFRGHQLIVAAKQKAADSMQQATAVHEDGDTPLLALTT